MMETTWRLTINLDDPPRRLMEEELERLLRQRGEPALVTIEYVSGAEPKGVNPQAVAA
jgi:hypothetical protein